MNQQLNLLFDEHIGKREHDDPTLADKANWKAQQSLITCLCQKMIKTDVKNITHENLENWIQSLGYYQQQKVRYPLARFFDSLLARNLLSFTHNPFKDGPGQIYLKKKPSRDRARMSLEDYKAIRRSAEEDGAMWFVNAMDLAYLLKCRRQDIVTLKFDDYDKTTRLLTKLILKSEHQKGEGCGDVLKWDLNEAYGPDVLQVYNRAYMTRKVILTPKNTEESPYIIHARPRNVRAKMSADKTHHSQVTESMISRTFKKYRDQHQFILNKATIQDKQPTTFHEIRSLSARMDEEKGIDIQVLSNSMAHSGLGSTKIYLGDGHRTKAATTMNRLADVI